MVHINLFGNMYLLDHDEGDSEEIHESRDETDHFHHLVLRPEVRSAGPGCVLLLFGLYGASHLHDKVYGGGF